MRQDHRAGAAARGGRHLRPQARQGGRRARLAAARRRARAQGARLPSLARHVVRGAGRARSKVLAAGLALAGGAPGTVSVGRDGFPVVACGVGGLKLLKLQRAGKAAQSADAFLRGFALAEPARCWRRPPSFRCRPDLHAPCRATSSPSNTTARRSSAGSARTTARRSRRPLEDAVLAFSGERVIAAGRRAHRYRRPCRWARWRISIWPARSPPRPCGRRSTSTSSPIRSPSPRRRSCRPTSMRAFRRRWRRYRYLILNRRAPPAIDRGRVWHVPVPLDADAMADAASVLQRPP